MLSGTQTDYKPSLISWNLTRRCNLRCPHCYMEAGEAGAAGRHTDARRNPELELSTDECLSLLDEMHDLGTEMVILTGGEPLLRKDIFDIARHASDLGIWVVMGTNGVMVTDRVAQKMVDCGIKGVGISIDSIDPQKHDNFRGGPGSWEHSVRALDICRAHGMEVLVQTTIMAMNYDEIPSLIEFARSKGAWSFNLYFLVQTGRGRSMNDLPPQQTAAMLTDMVDLQDRYRPMLVRAKCAPQFKQIAYDRGRSGLESGGCMAGTQYGRITPNGDVTPCPYMTVVAGNVRERSFTDIWQTSPVLQQLRDPQLLKGRCGRCEFNELCGGCRCRAYAAYGDYLQEDPACTYEPSGRALETPSIDWDRVARARLEEIPIAFIRDKVKRGVEAYAQRKAVGLITPEVLKDALSGSDRPRAFANFRSRRKHE